MRTIRFTRAARAELIDTQDWYESEMSGLGNRFQTEAARIVQRIAENPLQFPVVHKRIRRARLNVFPYSLFFCVESDDVFVIACFHSSRDPRQWQERG